MKGLSIENLPEHELNSAVTQNDILNWRNIVIFYTLRLFFAPLIESVILYDRVLYLLENGMHAIHTYIGKFTKKLYFCSACLRFSLNKN